MGIFTFLSSLFSGKGKQSKARRRNTTDSDVPPGLDIRLENTRAASPPPKKSNKSPKSAKPSADQEETLGFKVAGGRPGGKSERRRSYRVNYAGLVCKIKELQQVVRVRDISATGIGLLFKGKRIKAGTHLHLVLGADGKVLIKGLIMRVVRHDEGVLGGEFEELDRTHEDAINLLVLDAQKRRSERKTKPSA